MSGSLKKMEDTLSKWSGGAGKKQRLYLEIKNAASMLEWILRSVLYEEGIQSEIQSANIAWMTCTGKNWMRKTTAIRSYSSLEITF